MSGEGTTWSDEYGIVYADGDVDWQGSTAQGGPDFSDPERRKMARDERDTQVREAHLEPGPDAAITFVKRRRTVTVGLVQVVDESDTPAE